jgi:hypothetical protein
MDDEIMDSSNSSDTDTAEEDLDMSEEKQEN